jgi:hypothetical protein
VPDVSGVYGAPVELSATLTSQSGLGIVGKPITFFLNGIQVGPAVLTNSSGVASVSGVGTAGLGAGPHNGIILASFAGDSTYGAVQGLGNLTLSVASSNITLGNLTQTYNGTPLSPSVTTDPLGLSTSMSGAPQTNVGSYQVTATITDPNYTGSASGTFVIQPKAVTASITVSSKVYDGNTSVSITGCGLVGAVSGDNVGCTATSTFATAGVANNIVVTATSVSLTGSASGNYVLSGLPQTTANITLASSSVAITGGSFVYNGAAHAATGLASTSAGSLTSPATVTITYIGSCTSAPTTVADGTSCTATGTYAGDANHTGSSNTASITITKAGSTVAVTGGSFVYDTTAHAATGLASTTAGSLTNSTDVAITYTGSCSVAPTTVAEGSTCTATGTYAGDANHNGGSNTASITITKATQTVTLSPFATMASDKTVTFSASGNCTVDSSGLVTITGPTCSVTAAGPNYVSVTRNIAITIN